MYVTYIRTKTHGCVMMCDDTFMWCTLHKQNNEQNQASSSSVGEKPLTFLVEAINFARECVLF